MSAYRPGFAQQLPQDNSSIVSTGSISPNSIASYEVLMAEDEVVTTMEGDAVVGTSDITYLKLSLALGTASVAPDGTIIVTPSIPAGTDPLWSYVTLLADFDIPTGASVTNYPPRPTEISGYPSFPTQDSKLSQCRVANTILGSSLYPLFGKNTVGSLSVADSVIAGPGTGLLDDNKYDNFTGLTRNQRLFDSDFTIEGWDFLTTSVYLGTGGLAISLGQYKAGPAEYTIGTVLPKTGTAAHLREVIGTTPVAETAQYFTYNQPLEIWAHVCLERYNGIITVYVNGIAKASLFSIKKYHQATFAGHFHGPRRITQDIARYKGNFTPPNGPFLLGVPAPSAVRIYTP